MNLQSIVHACIHGWGGNLLYQCLPVHVLPFIVNTLTPPCLRLKVQVSGLLVVASVWGDTDNYQSY